MSKKNKKSLIRKFLDWFQSTKIFCWYYNFIVKTFPIIGKTAQGEYFINKIELCKMLVFHILVMILGGLLLGNILIFIFK